jgi:hypothetical protein
MEAKAVFRLIRGAGSKTRDMPVGLAREWIICKPELS